MSKCIKCKWAFDKEDEFCNSCDGIEMLVDGKKISCSECGGYEADKVEESVPTKEELETVEKQENLASDKQKENTINNTSEAENVATTKENTQENENKKESVEIVQEIKQEKETETVSSGVKVTSIRYTSGITIKRDDNYYKFIAEEEWQGNITDETRKSLWDKINNEVDNQLEQILK